MSGVEPTVIAGWSDILYWILRHLPAARGVGCELDPRVYQLTARNLEILEIPVRVDNSEYRSVLVREAAANERLVAAFIAPPWAKALDSKGGLDLLATTPPNHGDPGGIAKLIRGKACFVRHSGPRGRRTTLARGGQEKVRLEFPSNHPLNAPGQNHGILLGTKGWSPQ